MRRRSISERVDVVLDQVYAHPLHFRLFFKQLWDVHALSSTRYFFSAHEEIVAEGVAVVSGVWHRVEGPSRHWISHEHVEVSSEFLPHNSTQSTFCFS